MQKKSPRFFVGWQERFFVLKDSKLSYFENEHAKDPKGIINFDLMEATVHIVDSKKFK